MKKKNASGVRTGSGKQLCRLWKVEAHGYFHKDGTFYEIPKSFPAALCDPKGYALFKTLTDLKNCAAISMGVKLNVKGDGISKLSNYKQMR